MQILFLPFLTALLIHSTSANPHHTHPAHMQWVPCASHVPTALNPTIVDLAALPTTLHCGRIKVPMDYDRPMDEGNTIELGLAMHRPSGKSRGNVFYNPGGTDAGAVVAWEIALGRTEMFARMLDYDILVMDVRGTYSSNALNVSLELFDPLFGPYPTTQAEYDAFRNASAAVMQSWIVSSSPPGIVAHVSTKETVRDYEMIRRALGYDRINFLGASYGSYRAQEYAATFPERVGNFVLDAVAPHGLTMAESALNSISANNRALARVDAYCQNDLKCPLHSEGQGSVQAAFQALVKATRSQSTAEAFGIQQVVSGALQASPLPDLPAIAAGIHAALNGDFGFFTSSAPLTVEQVVALPLECAEQAESGMTFEGFNKSLAAGLKRDTSGVGIASGWQFQLWCSGWPFKFTRQKPLPVQKRMLLVTADFDAAAPTEWTTLAWRQMSNSGLVVRHGDDHVSFQITNATSTRLTEAFLRTGVLPKSRNETFVTVYEPGGVRAPVADPYNVPTGVEAGDVLG